MSFSCNDGYKLSSPEGVTCMENGVWSGPLPTCSKIREFQFLFFKFLFPNTAYAFFVYITLILPVSSTPPPPTHTHAAVCPALSLGNGTINSVETKPGTQVTFSCSGGYKLSGLQSVTCMENATWSGPTPTCSKISELQFF